ncbi:outer membrane beta-barrel protein [Porphyromonas macacae]|nr:outer membrane beta-barrel protein [Porphyromonas macacae]
MMKKFFYTIIVLVGLAVSANAQSVFRKGESMLNLGLGLNSLNNYTMVIPPLSASYELGLADNIFSNGNGSLGLGAYIGYASYKYKPYKVNSLKENHFVIGPRLALHYGFLGKLDTYLGLMLGYRSVSLSGDFGDIDSTSSGLAWNLNIGARYFFTPKVGAFMELGYGISNVNLGVTFRM